MLELVVTEYLYLNHGEPEGILTNWRSSLSAHRKVLAPPPSCGFVDLLRLSRGKTGGTRRAQILANSFEAVIGAPCTWTRAGKLQDIYYRKHPFYFEEILATGSWMDPNLSVRNRSGLRRASRLSTKCRRGRPRPRQNLYGGRLRGENYAAKGTGSSKQAG